MYLYCSCQIIIHYLSFHQFLCVFFKVAVCTTHGCTMSGPSSATTDAAGNYALKLTYSLASLLVHLALFLRFSFALRSRILRRFSCFVQHILLSAVHYKLYCHNMLIHFVLSMFKHESQTLKKA